MPKKKTKRDADTWSRQVDQKKSKRWVQQRQKILHSAARLFSKNGYLGTSTDAIAERAEVNKAIIYYYFQSKAFLLYEIISSTLNALIDLAIPIAQSNERPKEKLAKLIRVHIEWQLSHHWISGMGYVERKNLPSKLCKAYINKRDQYEALFRKTIEMGMKNGEFRFTDAKLTSLFVLGTINSVILWYQHGGVLSPEEISSKACEFVMSALTGA